MENKALILLELRKLWGINALRYGRDRKCFRFLTLAGPLLLNILLACYLGGICYGLLRLGVAPGRIQTLVLFAVFAMMLMIGFFRTGPQLFSDANFDILISMPVTPKQIVSARWLRLYLENLPLSVLSAAACLTVLGREGEAGLYGSVLLLTSALFLPLMPIAVSGLLSIVTERLTAGRRGRVIFSAVLTVAELLAVGAALNLVPIEAMRLSDHLICWGLSLILTAVMTEAAAKAFLPILTGRKPGLPHKAAKETEWHRETLHRCLVRREWKQYLSHSTYVSNTVVGPILAVVVSAVLLFTDLSSLGLPLDLEPVLPFLPAMILAMMNPTACAISIEGKQWWILKTMPLRTRDIVLAKLRVGVTLPLLSAVLSSALLLVRNHQSAAQILTCLLVPASAALFSAVWGLTANFYFPNFHWEDEVEVVKQGAASFVGGVIPFLLLLACGGLSTALPSWGGPATACSLLALSGVLLQMLKKQKLPD